MNIAMKSQVLLTECDECQNGTLHSYSFWFLSFDKQFDVIMRHILLDLTAFVCFSHSDCFIV